MVLNGIHQALAITEVTRDFRKPAQLPFFVIQRRDNHAGPEMRPVLAHTPAFSLVMTLLDCCAKDRCRQVARAIFGSVEPGKVLADDFRSRYIP
jgi:hypothetical protein